MMVVFLVCVAATLVAYACCVATGRADDVEEAYWQSIKQHTKKQESSVYRGDDKMVQSELKDREAYRLMFPSYPDVVDVHQLCEMLGGISVKTAYKLLQNNEIAHLKVGRAYKIPKCHVVAYLQRCGDTVRDSGDSLA